MTPLPPWHDLQQCEADVGDMAIPELHEMDRGQSDGREDKASRSGWAHKKDSGNLESIKFLSYRGSWAQASGSDKKESIRIC